MNFRETHTGFQARRDAERQRRRGGGEGLGDGISHAEARRRGENPERELSGNKGCSWDALRATRNIFHALSASPRLRASHSPLRLCLSASLRETRRAAFTLVELLVVIVILGILLAMMVPAAGMILKRVKVAQARSDAQVVVATMSKYRLEYNRWPDVKEVAEGYPGTSKEWVDIMNPDITTGTSAKRDPNNFRQLRFLEMGKGMRIESGTHEGGFGDPFPHKDGRMPFLYAVDDDGDGHVKNPDPDKGGELIRADVVAWSAGPDGDYRSWEDNVTSWE